MERKIPTIETMLESLRECLDCVLDLSEATEREIQTEYSLLKTLGLIPKNPKSEANPLKHNRKRGVYGTDHSD